MITVYFFAGLRELASQSSCVLVWHSGLTAGNVRSMIADKWPTMQQLLRRSSLAINNQMAADEQLVPDGAEVALLPPVSGG